MVSLRDFGRHLALNLSHEGYMMPHVKEKRSPVLDLEEQHVSVPQCHQDEVARHDRDIRLMLSRAQYLEVTSAPVCFTY